MNLVAAMEMVMNDGYHPIMRMDIGPKTGLPGADDFSDFESFLQAYKQQLACLIGNAVDLNNRLAAIHAKYRPTPLLSALMEGPADAGRDVTRGGARYNSSGPTHSWSSRSSSSMTSS
jgi:formate C-acetyltransferase